MAIKRTRYLVAYDICDPKRLAKIHKKTESYAIGGQKSFYECWLNATEFAQFKLELTDLMDLAEDHLMIFQLDKDIEPLLFGVARLVKMEQPFLVV